MKWVSYVVALCTLVTYVFGTEFPRGITSKDDIAIGRYHECDLRDKPRAEDDIAIYRDSCHNRELIKLDDIATYKGRYHKKEVIISMDFPRGITSEEDRAGYCSKYGCGLPKNSYDTTELVLKFKQRMEGDSVAVDAMDLFLDCKYWFIVDYCEDHLNSMTEPNAHLFREAMVLLAPLFNLSNCKLDIGNCKERVVSIIGDPKSITSDYFRSEHRLLLFDMFFYGAVESAKRGCGWMLPEIGAAICDELEILAEIFKWEEYDGSKRKDVRRIAYNGARTEDHLRATATDVWPNLPDGTTVSLILALD